MSHVSICAQPMRYARNERTVLDAPALRINQGEVLHIVGANGVGKSTWLRALAGLNSALIDRVSWQGQALSNRNIAHDYAKQRLFVGHDLPLKDALSAIDNLRWWLSPWGITTNDCQTSLEQAGIRDHRVELARLSAGQRQRLLLAALMACPAKVWILDEPLTALDQEATQVFERQLTRHCQQGGAAILSSHHGLEGMASTRSVTLERPNSDLT